MVKYSYAIYLYILIFKGKKFPQKYKKVLKIYWPISLGLESSLTYCCSQGFELEKYRAWPGTFFFVKLCKYNKFKGHADIYMHIYQQHESLWWNTETPVYIHIYLIFPLLLMDFLLLP